MFVLSVIICIMCVLNFIFLVAIAGALVKLLKRTEQPAGQSQQNAQERELYFDGVRPLPSNWDGVSGQQ